MEQGCDWETQGAGSSTWISGSLTADYKTKYVGCETLEAPKRNWSNISEVYGLGVPVQGSGYFRGPMCVLAASSSCELCITG